MFAVNRELIVDFGQYYRLFTGMFLHAGILHLLFNMYALWIIGMQLESFFNTGSTNPGSIYVTIGIVVAVVGLIFTIIGINL